MTALAHRLLVAMLKMGHRECEHMINAELQARCELGQRQLMLMDYLAAEATLVEAERSAVELSDFDTLARLYMPLQEARRQRRQRCGEGMVNLRLVASGPDDRGIDPERLIEQYPQGQLLIAGWGTIEPAVRFRKLAWERRLYVETYLGAVYLTDGGSRVVVIVGLHSPVTPVQGQPIAKLIELLPPHAILLREDELLGGARGGDFETYARTMALWERLHVPFLADADAKADSIAKMDGYRRAIAVDFACELAHQKLSAVARAYGRSRRA